MRAKYVLPALVGILLLAAVLRWADLAAMGDLLNHDEAYYLADAAELLDQPRLTPFFPGNSGREGGWIYLLALTLAGAGATPFAARFAATCIGILSVAATFRLGRELFDMRVGLGAAAGMAVLYWPMHMSHLILRANLLPLFGALSLMLLLTARRRNQLRDWLIAGLVIGATAYTYTSAYLWIVLAVIVLVYWMIARRAMRRSTLIALVVAIAVASPLAIYHLGHPDALLLRMRQSATLGEGAFVNALSAWLRAWLEQGDILVVQNIAGRPILDWSAAILFGLGLIGLLMRRAGAIALVLAMAAISILPSLLSEFPPHFLRAIGLTVPIALILGLGADSLARLIGGAAARLTPALSTAARNTLCFAFPASLFALTAITTARDFRESWLTDPRVELNFEVPAQRALQHLARLGQTADSASRAYLTPTEVSHPSVRWAQHVARPMRVGGFDSARCLIVATGPATYLIQSDKAKDAQMMLQQWGTIDQVATFAGAQTRADLVRLTPDTGALINADDRVTQYGQSIEIRTSTAPTITAQPGDTMTWPLRLRALRGLDRTYSLFLHLYRVDAAGIANDQRILAQGDHQMCASYPTVQWSPDEVAIETYNLTLPLDLPAGQYVVAIGVYDSDTGQRLAVTDLPGAAQAQFAALQHIRVNP